jgi:hypothetical protein
MQSAGGVAGLRWRDQAMNQVINTIVQLLQQGIAFIFKIVQLAWTWSFGEIVRIFQSNWQALPIWKMAVLAIVMIGIVVMGYKVLRQLWDAGEKLLRAFIALLAVLLGVLPYVVIAGVIAFAGGWVIKNVNF